MYEGYFTLVSLDQKLRRHLDIPIPYVLLLYIHCPLFLFPLFRQKKLNSEHVCCTVVMFGIPIPDM